MPVPSNVSYHGPSAGLSLPRCARCGHGPRDHRLDDATNVSPVDPDVKFRCLGHVDERSNRWVDTNCSCPDYQGPSRAHPGRRDE